MRYPLYSRVHEEGQVIRAGIVKTTFLWLLRQTAHGTLWSFIPGLIKIHGQCDTQHHILGENAEFVIASGCVIEITYLVP